MAGDSEASEPPVPIAVLDFNYVFVSHPWHWPALRFDPADFFLTGGLVLLDVIEFAPETLGVPATLLGPVAEPEPVPVPEPLTWRQKPAQF